MWVVQKIRGIFVISIKYRPLSVNWVEWKVVLRPRRKIILSVKLYYYRKESVRDRLNLKKKGFCVKIETYV
jgi:hypothetical protein